MESNLERSTAQHELKPSKDAAKRSNAHPSVDRNLSSDFQNYSKKRKLKTKELKHVDNMKGTSSKSSTNLLNGEFHPYAEVNENIQSRKSIENERETYCKAEIGNNAVESEMKKCEVCSKDVRTSTYASHLLWCLKRFGRDSVSRNIQKSEQDLCCICRQNLSGMSLEEKARHVNWCVDNPENKETSNLPLRPVEKIDVPEIITLECPLCGRIGESVTWRSSHIKRCAKSRNISTEQLITAVELQRRHAEERRAVGLPNIPPKRQVPRRHGNNQRVLRQIEPLTALQADMQMAVACSLSLQHEEQIKKGQHEEIIKVIEDQMEHQNKELERALGMEAYSTLPLVSKSKQKKGQSSAPVLLQRTKAERSKIIAQRLESVLEQNKDDSDEDDFPFLTNCKQLKTHCVTKSIPLPESRLWNLASLSEDVTGDPNNFYVPQLKPYFKPNKFKMGTKFRHLSQLPGYDLSKKAIQDEDDDALPSTMAILEKLHDDFSSPIPRTSNKDEVNVKDDSNVCRDGFFTQVKSSKPGNSEGTLHSFGMNFLSMVGNKILSDATITVEDGAVISCHKLMLYIRCPTLYQEVVESEATVNSEGCLSWPYVSHDAAIAFLQYIYTGKIVCKFDADEVIHLADKYHLSDLTAYVRLMPQTCTSTTYDNFDDSADYSSDHGKQENVEPPSIQSLLLESKSPDVEVAPRERTENKFGSSRSCEDLSDYSLSETSNKEMNSLNLRGSPLHESEHLIKDSEHDENPNNMAVESHSIVSSTEITPLQAETNMTAEEKNSNFMALKAEVAHLYSVMLETSPDALTHDNYMDTTKFIKSDSSRVDHDGSERSVSPELFDALHHSKSILTDKSNANFSHVCQTNYMPDLDISQETIPAMPKFDEDNENSYLDKVMNSVSPLVSPKHKSENNDLPISDKFALKRRKEYKHSSEITTIEQSWHSDTVHSSLPKQKSNTEIVSSSLPVSVQDCGLLKPLKLSGKYKIPRKLKIDRETSLDKRLSSSCGSGEIIRASKKRKSNSKNSNQKSTLTSSSRQESGTLKTDATSPSCSFSTVTSQHSHHSSPRKSPTLNMMNICVTGNHNSLPSNKKLKCDMKPKYQSISSHDSNKNSSDNEESSEKSNVLEENNGIRLSQLDDVWENFNDDCIGYDPFAPEMTPYISKSMISMMSERIHRLGTPTSRNDKNECRLRDLNSPAKNIYDLSLSEDSDPDCEPQGVQENNAKMKSSKSKTTKSLHNVKSSKTLDKGQKCITPMPRYSIMPTPDVRKELKKIGVRQLSKKKAVDLLKHVFVETHPGHPGISVSAPQSRKNVETVQHLTESKRCQSDTEVVQHPKSSTSSSSTSSNSRHKATSGIEEDSTNSHIRPSRSKASKAPVGTGDKSKVPQFQELQAFFGRREDWNLKILQYIPVDLSGLYLDLKEEGINYKLNDLKDELDRQGITYTSGQDSWKGKRKKRN